jgi:NADH-quinone oxidoreductase subunit G
MIIIYINEIAFVVKEDITLLDACKFVGINVPRFCYHETLSISGSCRMCLVKLNVEPKKDEDYDFEFIVSCVTIIQSEMSISTNDVIIQKVREEILELLLLDHPLDCPICDQGGECDLQDQAKSFGSTNTKLLFNKYSVEDKYFNTFIKTIMTRCIHCTRCVRFSSEIAGLDFFGTLSRGNFTEIGTFIPSSFHSEISANVIDLCPVGALTSKPYTFKARPWELKSVETIDLTDCLGSNIYINYIDTGVSRIIPKYNSDLNESLITDKARFVHDSSTPNLLNTTNSLLLDSTHDFKVSKKKSSKSLFVCSDELNLETLTLLKRASYSLNIAVVSSNFNKNSNNSNIFKNSLNTIKDISSSLNSIFLIATNLRTECALINLRLRFLSINSYTKILSLGFKYSSNINNSFLNINIKDIKGMLEGKKLVAPALILNADSPLLIFGESFKERGFNIEVLNNFLNRLNPSFIVVSLVSSCNSMGSNYLNIKSLNSSSLKYFDTIYFLGCRNSSFFNSLSFNELKETFKGKFSLNNKNLLWLNTVLKLKDYKFLNKSILVKNNIEESGIFLNIEFRPQLAQKVLNNKSNFKSYFTILDSLFNLKFKESKVNSFIAEFTDNSEKFSLSYDKKCYLNLLINLSLNSLQKSKLSNYPFKPETNDYYCTNNITENSKTLLFASQEYQKKWDNFFF